MDGKRTRSRNGIGIIVDLIVYKPIDFSTQGIEQVVLQASFKFAQKASYDWNFDQIPPIWARKLIDGFFYRKF